MLFFAYWLSNMCIKKTTHEIWRQAVATAKRFCRNDRRVSMLADDLFVDVGQGQP